MFAQRRGIAEGISKQGGRSGMVLCVSAPLRELFCAIVVSNARYEE